MTNTLYWLGLGALLAACGVHRPRVAYPADGIPRSLERLYDTTWGVVTRAGYPRVPCVYRGDVVFARPEEIARASYLCGGPPNAGAFYIREYPHDLTTDCMVYLGAPGSPMIMLPHRPGLFASAAERFQWRRYAIHEFLHAMGLHHGPEFDRLIELTERSRL